jgi:hypothetical protein
MFFATPSAPAEDVSTITFSDGSSVALDTWSMKPEVRTSSTNVLTFAWWESVHSELAAQDDNELVFHANVRLPAGEALLIDTGAPKNMTGDAWVERVTKHATAAGFGTELKPLNKAFSVDGVGQSSSTCNMHVSAPIALEDGSVGHFKASVISNSEVPALLGLESLESRRSLIDTVHGKIYELGPGPLKLSLPAGSVVRNMMKAPSGHLMFPCTAWPNAKPGGKQLAF